MTIDPLTGVYSRETLEQRLHAEVERAQQYGRPFSLLLIDLDHFKSVNDAFGHLRGDTVLAQFAQRLASMLRQTDIIYRYGGDEFLLFLPNTPKPQARQLGERLIEGVVQAPFPGQPPLTLGISLGLASFPEDGLTPEALFEKADQRHYEAKRRGRKQMVADDPQGSQGTRFDSEARLVERDEALNQLHKFLKNLSEQKWGVLAVTGSPGSGKSRFLTEAGNVARLQGYEVITFQGAPAYKNRLFWVLAEACRAWNLLAPPFGNPEEFLNSLEHLVSEKGRTGLLFVADDLAEVDAPTLELLRYLLLAQRPGLHLALVYSALPEAVSQLFPPVTSLNESIQLFPLSQNGVGIWLRLALKWEPPAAFVQWMCDQSLGRPGYLHQGLLRLLAEGVLIQNGAGWVFHHPYEAVPVKDSLEASAPQVYHLPAPPTYFLGREREVTEARRLVSQNRLLTLVGPGGVGKTRLALQAAAELAGSFPDGVCWVALAPADSRELMVSTLGAALKFTFFGSDAPEAQLANYLHEKKLLLVMDNFEHLASEAGLVAEFLDAAPGIKVLATSRERLNLRSEAVLELSGMQFPAAGNAQEAEAYTAVQLFVQSARRAVPEFRLDPGSRLAVARICQMVEGLPLGIELASAWVRVLSCAEIAAEIEQNLDFLSAPLRDLPERHRSLRAVFEHSWRLLTEAERSALCAISIFHGGFTRLAAEVAGASLSDLASLLDKTLLRRTETGRYEMHEVLRQYAWEKLQATPEQCQNVRQKHSLYYLDLLSQHTLAFQDWRYKESLAVVEQEMDNVRTAWRWARRNAQYDLLEKAFLSLFLFFEIRNLFQEGEQTFAKTVATLEERGQTGLPEHEYLVALLNAGRGCFFYATSRYEQAQELLHGSLQVLRRHQALSDLVEPRDRQAVSWIAFCLVALGRVYSDIGQFDQAQRFLEEALELYQQLGDLRGIGRCHVELSGVDYQKGEYASSETHARQCLDIFSQLKDPLNQARALVSLANIAVEMGEYQQASEAYQHALTLCQELGYKTGVATILNNLGDLEMGRGSLEPARHYLSQSYALYTQIGEPNGRAYALSNLGDVAYRQGAYPEALQLFNQALEIRQQMNVPIGVAYSLSQLGSVACALGDLISAQDHLYAALETAQQTQTLPLVMEIIISFVRLFIKLGHQQYALELLAFALQHPATLKYHREEAEKLRPLLESRLTPAAVEAATQKGRLRPVSAVVAALQANRSLILNHME